MRVCCDKYPKGFSYNIKPGFYMDNKLKMQLDILLKNIVNDWDFTILITGSGEVRVGKSVLAMEIAAYWAYMIDRLYGIKTHLDIDNFVFDGRKLIEMGNQLGQKYPYSCLIYDEAGADLAGSKVLTQMTRDVMDFYRECGQYNLLNILVLPDFFDLPKSIAITRSIFLINVDYESDEDGVFKRGIFKFYSRKSKKKLYMLGKKELNYNATAYDFTGRFLAFYPIDEKGYRDTKVAALRHRENRSTSTTLDQRDYAWYKLVKEFGVTCAKLSRETSEITGRSISSDAILLAIRRYLPR